MIKYTSKDRAESMLEMYQVAWQLFDKLGGHEKYDGGLFEIEAVW